MFYILEESFQVYDGFIYPNATLWNNYFSNTGIHTKDSHGYALVIFLKKINLDISGFDISRTYETVRSVYLQLKHKEYLFYHDVKRVAQFCCTDQLDKGLQQVYKMYM